MSATSYKQLEYIYKRFRPSLLAFANNYVKNTEDADEIINDTFLAVWNKRDYLKLDDDLKSYLYKAVKNKCLNKLKGIKPNFTEIEDFHPQETSNALNQLEFEELSDYITALIDTLPEKRKQIFLMSRMDGLPHKEIADLLDISSKTVENQIGLALKFLKSKINTNADKGNANELLAIAMLFLVEI